MNKKTVLTIAVFVVILTIVSFGLTALALYCICSACHFEYSFKLVVGVWLLLSLISSSFKSNIKIKE